MIHHSYLERLCKMNPLERSNNINELTQLVATQFPHYYSELQRYGIHPIMIRTVFESVIRYVLRSSETSPADPDQGTNQIFNAIKRRNPSILYILRNYGVPQNKVNKIIKDIIYFILLIVVRNHYLHHLVPLILPQVGANGKIWVVF